MISVRGGYRRVQAQLTGAQAVYLMGEFNNWSTTATPMQLVADELWEATLDPDVRPHSFRLFVWDEGRRIGRIMPWSANSLQTAGR